MTDHFGDDLLRRLRTSEETMAPLRKGLGLPATIDGVLSVRMWRRCSPIKVMAKHAELSLERLAEEAGVDDRTLRRWANGENVPTPRYLAKLSAVLKVSPHTLWASHLTWLSFRPLLDEASVKRAANEARRSVHPIYRVAQLKGISFKELALLSGVGTTTLSRLWGATTPPHLTTLLKLCEALEIDVGATAKLCSLWSSTFTGVAPLDIPGVAAEFEMQHLAGDGPVQEGESNDNV